MPTANKARGEQELEVDGRSYVLRPSFETLSKIEDITNRGAIELIGQIREQTISMKNIVVILWMAAKGSGNRDVPGITEFGEFMRRGQGLAVVGFVALGFLSASISTDQQLEEAAAEAKALEDDPSDSDPSEPSEEQAPADGKGPTD